MEQILEILNEIDDTIDYEKEKALTIFWTRSA